MAKEADYRGRASKACATDGRPTRGSGQRNELSGTQLRRERCRRGFLRAAVGCEGLRRAGGPAEGARNAVKDLAAGSFDAQALVGHATQKHAALLGLEREEVRPAEEVAALVVLQFERLAIAAKEARRVCIACQAQPERQQQPLGLLVLEDGVAVTRPSRREARGALFAKELLQQLVQAKFAQDVLVEFVPTRRQQRAEVGQGDRLGRDALEIQVGVEDLLR